MFAENRRRYKMKIMILPVEDKKYIPVSYNEKLDRNLDVLKLRVMGKTRKELAKRFKISGRMIDYVTKKAARRILEEERVEYLTPAQIVDEYREEIKNIILNR